MISNEVRELLKLVTFPLYTFVVLDEGGRMMLQARYDDRDIVTGAVEEQHTRKWHISEHATKSEIVQTAFKCVMTSMEHRAREHFRYRGKAVFGPHFDVDALHSICSDRLFDYRRELKEKANV